MYVADATGTRQIDVADDLTDGRYDPPPVEAMETDYERMIGHGLDIPPYTRLARTFRAQIEGAPPPTRSEPATLHDGVAALEVLEAVRHSATEGRRVEVGDA